MSRRRLLLTTNLKAAALSALITLLTVSSAESLSAEPSFPPDWNVDTGTRFGQSECPPIAGIYKRNGELHMVMMKDGEKTTESKPSGSLIWAGHPRDVDKSARASLPVTAQDRNDAHTFWIEQRSTTRFEVRWLHWDRINVNSVVFDQQMNDFTCDGGFIVLRMEDTQGYRGSEGVATNARAQTRIAKGADGSIMYHRHLKAKSKSMLVFVSELESESFFRFPSAN